MQPWGELTSAYGDDLWDIEEGGTGGKALHMGCGLCRGQWGHTESRQQSWTLLPVLAFLSVVASMPTTQYWAVVQVSAQQLTQ